MTRGRGGRYQIRKTIGLVLKEAQEPLSAEQIGERLTNLRSKYRNQRRYRNVGYSNNSISQMLRGAHGVSTGNVSRGREFNHNRVKTFQLTDENRFVTWVESKRVKR